MKDMKYKLKKDLVIQQVNDEVFIFDGETSILHTLNQSAAELFNQLKKGASIADLGNYLVNEYEVPLDRAIKDSKDFIGKLEKKQLIIKEKS